jgi:gas vesicle protein
MEDDSKLSYFFLGLGLGVAAGILFAPKSGLETREIIKHKAGEGQDFIKRRSGEIRGTANDLMDRGRSILHRQKDQLNEAVEAGKQAYREAVSGTTERSTTNEGY